MKTTTHHLSILTADLSTKLQGYVCPLSLFRLKLLSDEEKKMVNVAKESSYVTFIRHTDIFISLGISNIT